MIFYCDWFTLPGYQYIGERWPQNSYKAGKPEILSPAFAL